MPLQDRTATTKRKEAYADRDGANFIVTYFISVRVFVLHVEKIFKNHIFMRYEVVIDKSYLPRACSVLH